VLGAGDRSPNHRTNRGRDKKHHVILLLLEKAAEAEAEMKAGPGAVEKEAGGKNESGLS
jgi:hypothetical protein